jgi:hypothetical protein
LDFLRHGSGVQWVFRASLWHSALRDLAECVKPPSRATNSARTNSFSPTDSADDPVVNGFVDDRDRALVSIRVASKLSGEMAEVLGWIDTAFDGHLVFSRE